jgi:DNA (cytosine-5)-methyltransferase 1
MIHPFSFNYPSRISSDVPKCVDLFCGAGGLSLGFCQAGGIPAAAVDLDEASVETYRRMFPFCEKEVSCKDIRTWKPTLRKREVDVVIGGPPCQGFSLARGSRFVDDPRNGLYKEFVRIVAALEPKWIVMENVPGITNLGQGIILQEIKQDFASIGYHIDCKVINMEDYGVPQARKRAIFVGTRLKCRIPWPVQTHSRKNNGSCGDFFIASSNVVTIEAALGDLPWPLGRYFAHRANSQMRGPRNRCVLTDTAFTLRVRGDEFAMCEEPASGAFVPGPLPDVELRYRAPENDFQKLMRQRPPSWIGSVVVQELTNRSAHWLRGTRKLAMREQARLQTFPDWFQFCGSSYRQGFQIGNAVPPLFARMLFAEILEHL